MSARAGCVIALAVATGAFVGLLAWAAARGPGAPPPDPTIGYLRRVPSSCQVVVYRNRTDVDEEIDLWTDAQAVRDDAPEKHITRAVLAGRAWQPSPGTSLKVIGRRDGLYEVEIQDGISRGHVGWTWNTRCLNLPPNYTPVAS